MVLNLCFAAVKNQPKDALHFALVFSGKSLTTNITSFYAVKY
tara:strand:- start:904 stop:1029 length:126 start_codon:yes stop_codon:yes gene_type:complete